MSKNENQIPKNVGMSFDPLTQLYWIGDVVLNEKAIDKLALMQECGAGFAQILPKIALSIAADKEISDRLFETEMDKAEFFSTIKVVTTFSSMLDKLWKNEHNEED